MLNWGRKKRLFVFDWQELDALHTFAPLASDSYAIFLDSARPSHPLSRYSYICWDPFEIIECTGSEVTINNRNNQVSYSADPFQVIRERLKLWGENAQTKDGLPPFQGGAAGFFGYDLVRAIEKIPAKAKNGGVPDLCVGIYDKVIGFDHGNNKAYLMIHADDEKEAISYKENLEQEISSYHYSATFSGIDLDWQTPRSDDEYKRDIARVVEYIYAGDIFQANLSRRFKAQLPQGFDAFLHYRHLRSVNPAPYAAYMNFGNLKLASCSPERFLCVEDRVIETRPIKGTLPDNLSEEILKQSEKDRAENTMIVDLLRNDLSKVCKDHSIEVMKLCDIEAFEGLHHMVSTVKGELRADQSAMDALRACFPGGSITGAPKIRAMEIINELEPDRRGPYCGAIGFCGFDGTMDMAITIRTLVYEGNQVHLQAGGGITAQSDPAKELEEVYTKAKKIFESFCMDKIIRKSA